MHRRIAKLEEALRASSPVLFAQLRPGLAAGELDAWQAEVGAQFRLELRELYQWRDGQPNECRESLIGNYMFLSSAASRAAWKTLCEMANDGDLSGPWNPRWLPFLDNGGGDHLCIDLAGDTTGVPGAIIEYWHDDEDRTVVAPSLTSWLDTILVEFGTLVAQIAQPTMPPLEGLEIPALLLQRVRDASVNSVEELLQLSPLHFKNPKHRSQIRDALAKYGLSWGES